MTNSSLQSRTPTEYNFEKLKIKICQDKQKIHFIMNFFEEMRYIYLKLTDSNI